MGGPFTGCEHAWLEERPERELQHTRMRRASAKGVRGSCKSQQGQPPINHQHDLPLLSSSPSALCVIRAAWCSRWRSTPRGSLHSALVMGLHSPQRCERKEERRRGEDTKSKLLLVLLLLLLSTRGRRSDGGGGGGGGAQRNMKRPTTAVPLHQRRTANQANKEKRSNRENKTKQLTRTLNAHVLCNSIPFMLEQRVREGCSFNISSNNISGTANGWH